MGIDIETARFMLARRRQGASFARSACLGRQHFFLGHTETRGLLREFGLDPAASPELFSKTYPDFADEFWKLLGAKEMTVFDASDFEGATRVHDMNQPITEELKQAFDVVCDIGTLEHVFNFPVAVRNCMEMTKVGGHCFCVSPANNAFGHGFYQFSPELYFRVFSPENGFQIERCVAVEYGARTRWYEVIDPKTAGARVTLINAATVTLLVWARRIRAVPLFQNSPQQSDYSATWARSAAADQKMETPARPTALQRLQRAVLESMPSFARTLDRLRYSRFNRNFSLANRRSFAPISKWD